eukprot:CAMPEP_0177667248 /NCGR_PEP_ID=MMETSP0447-20121125/22017_1 /TAXON_ID=0 /ORGANISM="Stygamoeba regulata, Strain BSH-02190019" /LENGTH=151 /DNA_ID=CAMNT_0019173457 /DNA_START=121 /DNA_END=576 /DNA_ORIENTATION=-
MSETRTQPPSASRTHTITIEQASEEHAHREDDEIVLFSLPSQTQRRKKTKAQVHWTNDVVDNEHLGRKSSKVCCIYHKPRRFDESSSESDGGPAFVRPTPRFSTSKGGPASGTAQTQSHCCSSVVVQDPVKEPTEQDVPAEDECAENKMSD